MLKGSAKNNHSRYQFIIKELLLIGVISLLFSISQHCYSQFHDSITIRLEHDQTIHLIQTNDKEGINIKSPSFSIYWQSNSNQPIQVRYRLLPQYSNWSDWTTRNSIAYFDLSDDQYILQLKLVNGHIIESKIKVDVPLKNKTWFNLLLILLISIILLVLMLVFFNRRLSVIRKRIEYELKKALRIKQSAEVEKSGEDASTVRDQARIRSRKYKKVTVLFADIQGFTRIVEHLNPEALIDELDRFFFHFDELAEKFGIEKIKTIGDAYMCAGGIPNKNRTNPIEVVLAAILMQQFMKKSQENRDEDFGFWELRIGIHTGPVISGVIGQKKLSFDIWGDTVNIASRMESSGIAGEINITGITYQLIKEFFTCEYRGKMPIKYKGETDMYFVKGIKPELSMNEAGLEPNRIFYTRLQHIRFTDLEEYVLTKYETELNDVIYYHNKAHTEDVITRVEILARGEGVSEEDLLLLKTAALLHDSGFLIEYDHHEDNSIHFTKEILPQYNYADYQIDQIVELIDVTRTNKKPRNFLEKIIKDADLDYLGRADFIPVSENLFKELNAHGRNLSLTDWNKMQFEFISQHTYYTKTARNLRHVNKERQLQKLKELISI